MTAVYGRYGRDCIIAGTAQIGEHTRVGNFVSIRDHTVIARRKNNVPIPGREDR
jgi:UDP-3-O-[3-hydroxymyristoyl] glucosamine N-acyltransferase